MKLKKKGFTYGVSDHSLIGPGNKIYNYFKADKNGICIVLFDFDDNEQIHEDYDVPGNTYNGLWTKSITKKEFETKYMEICNKNIERYTNLKNKLIDGK